MTYALNFEWDSAKAQVNIRKHGISFDQATEVFRDPLLLSMIDPDNTEEERWLTVGKAQDNTLMVVHTFQEEENQTNVRIISARKATKQEQRQYENG